MHNVDASNLYFAWQRLECISLDPTLSPLWHPGFASYRIVSYGADRKSSLQLSRRAFDELWNRLPCRRDRQAAGFCIIRPKLIGLMQLRTFLARSSLVTSRSKPANMPYLQNAARYRHSHFTSICRRPTDTCLY